MKFSISKDEREKILNNKVVFEGVKDFLAAYKEDSAEKWLAENPDVVQAINHMAKSLKTIEKHEENA